jgi:superfamily II DNA or RNA helicase
VPKKKKLRDYQSDAIDQIRQSFREGNKRVVLQMPTGGGKTAVAGAIIRMAREKGSRVCFVVPALSLITQTVNSFIADGLLDEDIGVIQAMHERTDWRRPIQIASVQTLNRRELPDVDLWVIDECHIVFKLYLTICQGSTPMIGLSATPWARSLGRIYQKLIIGTTTQDLIDKGHLSGFVAYAPAHPDLSGVRSLAGDYHEGDLGNVMDSDELIADVVDTWLKKGEGRPTLCFCVNRLHAKHMCEQFKQSGVRAEYVDAFTEIEERDRINASFRAGDLDIICNVGVLTTGVDLPFVSCIILCRPTRSEILYTQIIGRGLRRHPGKDDCLILDHSSTTSRLGFVTDIVKDTLDQGERNVQKADRKEPLPKECPKCHYLRPVKVSTCPACGFKAVATNNIETEEGELHQVKSTGRKATSTEKAQFFAEIKWYALQRGYSKGWAAHLFKERYKVWPNHYQDVLPHFATQDTVNYIKSRQIAYAKRKAK